MNAAVDQTRVPARGRIKGAAFREVVVWFERELGQGPFFDAYDRLPPEMERGLFVSRPALGLLSGSWYEAEVVHALLDALTAEMGAAERRRVADTCATHVMSTMLSGIYKMLFHLMASPETYLRYGPKLWDSFFDSGTFELERVSDTAACCTISRWESHHGFMCDLNRAASAQIYRAMGCEDVTCTREACVTEGAPHCKFVTRWTGWTSPV